MKEVTKFMYVAVFDYVREGFTFIDHAISTDSLQLCLVNAERKLMDKGKSKASYKIHKANFEHGVIHPVLIDKRDTDKAYEVALEVEKRADFISQLNVCEKVKTKLKYINSKCLFDCKIIDSNKVQVGNRIIRSSTNPVYMPQDITVDFKYISGWELKGEYEDSKFYVN